LTHRHNTFTVKLQKQESDISRLRSQLSVVATPNSEIETRMSSLTRTLVLKQQELEHLTTDRNSLRLRLEKLEVHWCFMYRSYINIMEKNES
jgi:chromosome segregation ATPase